jgi:hypothetical protein
MPWTWKRPRSPAAPVAFGLPPDSHRMIRKAVSTANAGKMLSTSPRHCSTLAGTEGFEPPTGAFGVRCSTTELRSCAATIAVGTEGNCEASPVSSLTTVVPCALMGRAVLVPTFHGLAVAVIVALGGAVRMGDGISPTDASPHPTVAVLAATRNAQAASTRKLSCSLVWRRGLHAPADTPLSLAPPDPSAPPPAEGA